MLTVNFCGNRVGPMIPVIRKKKKKERSGEQHTIKVCGEVNMKGIF